MNMPIKPKTLISSKRKDPAGAAKIRLRLSDRIKTERTAVGIGTELKGGPNKKTGASRVASNKAARIKDEEKENATRNPEFQR
jgi:hypothetical protein